MTARLEWLQKSFQTNSNPSNFNIYNLGDTAVNAGRLDIADSMFNVYKTKYLDQIYGYMGLTRSAIAKDKDTATGPSKNVKKKG